MQKTGEHAPASAGKVIQSQQSVDPLMLATHRTKKSAEINTHNVDVFTCKHTYPGRHKEKLRNKALLWGKQGHTFVFWAAPITHSRQGGISLWCPPPPFLFFSVECSAVSMYVCVASIYITPERVVVLASHQQLFAYFCVVFPPFLIVPPVHVPFVSTFPFWLSHCLQAWRDQSYLDHPQQHINLSSLISTLVISAKTLNVLLTGSI